MSMKIYLSTSWRNQHYDRILALLREAGHKVYDFKQNQLHFEELLPDYKSKSPAEQVSIFSNPKCIAAFHNDISNLDWADVVIMLYPCGNDAHTELGYAYASGKSCIIYAGEKPEDFNLSLFDRSASTFVFTDSQLLEELR